MSKKKVMVLDDEEHFLKIMKLNLDLTQDYDTLTLSSAEDILKHVHAFKPDIIILDLLIGNIRGLDVCQMLNNDPTARGIPIIIFSALDKDKDKIKAFELGAKDFLVKPLEINVLTSAIKKILGAKEGQ